jgi:hypothetical protein
MSCVRLCVERKQIGGRPQKWHAHRFGLAPRNTVK